MENRKQLTARPSQQLAATPKTGQTNNEISFVKSIPQQTSIREHLAAGQKLSPMLNPLFVVIANALAIANPIGPLTKKELVELFKMRFANFSIEEVEFAFKLDRFGFFGDPTPHYQAFTVDFAAKVMNRYKKWLSDTRTEQGLAMPGSQPEAPPELSEDQKNKIIQEGLVRCFEEYKETAKIDPGRLYVYSELHRRGLLPLHTPEFKAGIAKRAREKSIAQAELKKTASKGDKFKRKDAQQVINALKAGGIAPGFQAAQKEIVIRDYFNRLIIERKELTDILNN